MRYALVVYYVKICYDGYMTLEKNQEFVSDFFESDSHSVDAQRDALTYKLNDALSHGEQDPVLKELENVCESLESNWPGKSSLIASFPDECHSFPFDLNDPNVHEKLRKWARAYVFSGNSPETVLRFTSPPYTDRDTLLHEAFEEACGHVILDRGVFRIYMKFLESLNDEIVTKSTSHVVKVIDKYIADEEIRVEDLRILMSKADRDQCNNAVVASLLNAHEDLLSVCIQGERTGYFHIAYKLAKRMMQFDVPFPEVEKSRAHQFLNQFINQDSNYRYSWHWPHMLMFVGLHGQDLNDKEQNFSKIACNESLGDKEAQELLDERRLWDSVGLGDYVPLPVQKQADTGLQPETDHLFDL